MALFAPPFPFSTPLRPACPTIYLSGQLLLWHGVVSNDRDESTWRGAAGSWSSGKTASPSSSSILQSYLVKANTGQHFPSCHWKRGSDALAWHANIVTCTNGDAKLASLFMASLKEEEKFEVIGKQRMFRSPIESCLLSAEKLRSTSSSWCNKQARLTKNGLQVYGKVVCMMVFLSNKVKNITTLFTQAFAAASLSSFWRCNPSNFIFKCDAQTVQIK